MKKISVVCLMIFMSSVCFAKTNFQLNKKIETGATVKKIEQSKQILKITVYMKNRTAKKYSVDETDSLNRFVVEKIHPSYCQFFKNKNTKPDLYVDLVDRKNKSFFGSAEKYKDTCI